MACAVCVSCAASLLPPARLSPPPIPHLPLDPAPHVASRPHQHRAPRPLDPAQLGRPTGGG
eukprot:9413637-Pyramimonas_sp.AAC.1